MKETVGVTPAFGNAVFWATVENKGRKAVQCRQTHDEVHAVCALLAPVFQEHVGALFSEPELKGKITEILNLDRWSPQLRTAVSVATFCFKRVPT